ncbi:MAG: hypothetical protein WEC84_02315 [Candidatus Andersenbacteria bacterium]
MTKEIQLFIKPSPSRWFILLPFIALAFFVLSIGTPQAAWAVSLQATSGPGGPGVCLFGVFEADFPGLPNRPCIESVGWLELVNLVINFVIVVVILIGTISILIGGYIYMVAGGSADRIGSAKKWLGSALLGITLAVTAWLILHTISPQFTENAQDPICTFLPTLNQQIQKGQAEVARLERRLAEVLEIGEPPLRPNTIHNVKTLLEGERNKLNSLTTKKNTLYKDCE